MSPAAHGFDLFAPVRVHAQQALDPLGAILAAVQQTVAATKGARVDPDEAQGPRFAVVLELEGKREGRPRRRPGQRRQVPRAPLAVEQSQGRKFVRCRKVPDDRIQQRLDADVAPRGAGEHRYQPARSHRRAHRLAQQRGGQLAAFQIPLGYLVRPVGKCVDEKLPRPRKIRIGRIRRRTLHHGAVIAPRDPLHRDQIDDPAQIAVLAPRHLQRYRLGGEQAAHLLKHRSERCAGPIQLVDECDAGDRVTIRLMPYGLRLRLDPLHGREDRHRAVQHAHRTLHLGREVDVTRGIDDVDLVVGPEAGGCGGGDADAAFLFLRHPVGGRLAVVDLADAVGASGEIEHSLRGGGLAGIDVRDDSYVADGRHGVPWDGLPVPVLMVRQWGARSRTFRAGPPCAGRRRARMPARPGTKSARASTLYSRRTR